MTLGRKRRASGSVNHRRHTGQALVEFALVLPVFLLVLFGLIDVGRYVYMNSTLSQAAREGARVGAVQAGWLGKTTTDDPSCNQPGGPVCPINLAALRSNVTTAANSEMQPFGNVGNVYTSCDLAPDPVTNLPALPSGAWTTATCATHDPGDYISVRVTSTFLPITPGLSSLIGSTLLAASSSFVIN